jgi:dipeptidyl-peptidase-4
MSLTAPLRLCVAVSGLFLAAIGSDVIAQPVAPAALRPTLTNVEFLEQFAATNRFRLGQPTAITITPDASGVLFLRAENGRSFKQDLWMFDIATKQERLLLTADQLLGGKEENLSPEELARRERMRMSSRGISSYQLSDDGKRLLVPLSGRLFVADFIASYAAAVAGGGAPNVREITSEVGSPIDPQFSPDGKQLAAVRGGEIYVYDIDSGTETQLTRGAGGPVSHGEAEFVAQEEMGRRHGYWWSPDSTHIAFQRTDTSRVQTFTIGDASDPAKPAQSWPYPRAGTANADVSLWIAPVPRRTSPADPAEYRPPLPVRVDWSTYPYLAKVVWEKHGPLTILVQNRLQTEQVLYAVDDNTGEVRELLKEQDETWINIQDDVPIWLEDGSFIWMSEQHDKGAWELQFRDARGEITSTAYGKPGEGSLLGISGADSTGRYVMLKARMSGISNLLWAAERGRLKDWADRVGLGGGEMPRQGNIEATFSRDLLTWVEARTSNSQDPQWFVRRRPHFDGRNEVELGQLTSKAEQPPLKPTNEYVVADQQPGSPHFNAAIIRPRDFNPRSGTKYPVLNFAYTGPGVNTVQPNGRAYLLHQWFADQGFIVVTIDGRGTPRRGRAWERAIKNDMISSPLQDQCDALLALCEKFPEMDKDRIGVYGWSYGGYFAAMATMQRPDIFKAGVAGAPAADWRDYDTHYTERYLGMPLPADQLTDGVPGNQSGYDASNVLTYCKDLQVPLLLIHGTADDNVYFTHSLKIADALTRAGKSYEFMPLSGQTHMVTQPALVKAINTRMAEFFITHLGGPK